MGERRKSTYTWLLKKQGKNGNTLKVDLFDASLWGDDPGKYRVRINGRWYSDKEGEREYFTKDEFKEVLFRSLEF